MVALSDEAHALSDQRHDIDDLNTICDWPMKGSGDLISEKPMPSRIGHVAYETTIIDRLSGEKGRGPEGGEGLVSIRGELAAAQVSVRETLTEISRQHAPATLGPPLHTGAPMPRRCS